MHRCILLKSNLHFVDCAQCIWATSNKTKQILKFLPGIENKTRIPNLCAGIDGPDCRTTQSQPRLVNINVAVQKQLAIAPKFAKLDKLRESWIAPRPLQMFNDRTCSPQMRIEAHIDARTCIGCAYVHMHSRNFQCLYCNPTLPFVTLAVIRSFSSPLLRYTLID